VSDQADKVAARLAKFGNNIVRFTSWTCNASEWAAGAGRQGHAYLGTRSAGPPRLLHRAAHPAGHPYLPLHAERKIGTESWHVRFEQFGLKLAAGAGLHGHLVGQGGEASGVGASAWRWGTRRGRPSAGRALSRSAPSGRPAAWWCSRAPARRTPGWCSTRHADRAIWLAGISLRSGGVTGLPAGETLQAVTVAGLRHDQLASRSSSATRDWVRFLWETEDAYWQTLEPLPEGRAAGAGSGDRPLWSAAARRT